LADLNWRFPFLIYLMALLLLPCALAILPEPPRATPAVAGASTPPAALPVTLIALTYGVALMTQVVFYLVPVQLPFYLKQLFSANAAQSGLAIALATLFSAFSSIMYRQIKAKLNFVAVYGLAFANIALGYALISWAAHPLVLLAGLVVAGLGLGLLMPNMNFCLSSVTPDAMRGRILSGITTFFFLGQFLSPLVSQPLSREIGLGRTYGVAAMVMVALTVGAAVLFKRWR
jgi:MFS family permease